MQNPLKYLRELNSLALRLRSNKYSETDRDPDSKKSRSIEIYIAIHEYDILHAQYIT